MPAGKYQHLSPGFKMLLLLLMMLAAVIIVSLLVSVSSWSLYGSPNIDFNILISDVRLIKLMQFIQSVFVFILPSIIAAYMFFPGFMKSLYGDSKLNFNILLASALAIFISQYFIGWTGSVNNHLVLPEYLNGFEEWIERTEKEAMVLTAKLTSENTGFGFIINVFIIAFIPALGEEWLFRGHIQRYIDEWMKNSHLAIFLTSVLFAAMHLQFMTFLPRFFLGMILGYLFWSGGNLWYSVTGHFTNNFIALLLMSANGTVDNAGLEANEFNIDIPFSSGVILSFAGVLVVLIIIGRIKYLKESVKGT